MTGTGRSRKAGRWLPSALLGSLRAVRLLARAGAWPARDRFVLVAAAARLAVIAALVAAVAVRRAARPLPRWRPPRCATLRFAAGGSSRRRGSVAGAAHPGDGLADQLLDRVDRLAVDGRDDGDGGAAQAGAAGAADAVDVIVGVMRHVEIEDVAHRRDVEAARGDVGGDQAA